MLIFAKIRLFLKKKENRCQGVLKGSIMLNMRTLYKKTQSNCR